MEDQFTFSAMSSPSSPADVSSPPSPVNTTIIPLNHHLLTQISSHLSRSASPRGETHLSRSASPLHNISDDQVLSPTISPNQPDLDRVLYDAGSLDITESNNSQPMSSPTHNPHTQHEPTSMVPPQNTPTSSPTTISPSPPDTIPDSPHSPPNLNLPTNTHPMRTRAKNKIIKPNPKFSLTVSTKPVIPTTTTQALRDPFWRNAMSLEYTAVTHDNTFDMVPPSPSQHVIPTKWIFHS